ncbi:MAG: FlgD immunoglobulin-like domain containing protein, partial [bacterium]
TEIKFSIAQNVRSIRLQIYDTAGRLVRVFPIVNLCNLNKSVVSVCWDGTNDIGQKLPAGVYFVRFLVSPAGESEDSKQIQKAVLLY